eukprot:3867649-Pleurochrysis_carterae.AAC.1
MRRRGRQRKGAGTREAHAQQRRRHSKDAGTAKAQAQQRRRHSRGAGTAEAQVQQRRRHSRGIGTAEAQAQQRRRHSSRDAGIAEAHAQQRRTHSRGARASGCNMLCSCSPCMLSVNIINMLLLKNTCAAVYLLGRGGGIQEPQCAEAGYAGYHHRVLHMGLWWY